MRNGNRLRASRPALHVAKVAAGAATIVRVDSRWATLEGAGPMPAGAHSSAEEDKKQAARCESPGRQEGARMCGAS